MKTGLEAQLLRASQTGNVSLASSQVFQDAYNKMIKDIENSLYYGNGAGIDFGYSERLPDREEKKKKEESKKALKNLLENT